MFYRYAKGLLCIYCVTTTANPAHTRLVSISIFLIYIFSRRFCFAIAHRVFCHCFLVLWICSFRSAGKGFTNNGGRVRCALYLFFCFFFFSFFYRFLCQLPKEKRMQERKKNAVHRTHSHLTHTSRQATEAVKLLKDDGDDDGDDDNSNEIFERFMNLCICYTLCVVAQTSCFVHSSYSCEF